MIEHAASHGIELNDDAVEPVIDFARKWGDDPSKTSSEEETRFWIAASQLAKLVAPSSPEALRTLRNYNQRSSSNKVRRVARWSTIGAWTILALTLLVHSYHNTLYTMIRTADEAAEDFASVQSEVAAVVPPDDANPDFDQAEGAFKQSMILARNRYCRSAGAWTTQVGLIQGLIPQGEGSIPYALVTRGLQWLPFVDSKTSTVLGGPFSVADYNKEMSQYRCDVEIGPPFERASSPTRSVTYRELRASILSTALGTDDARKMVQWAKVDRTFFAQFGLPLLYGLLGALANVVRQFGRAVQDAQFSPASGLAYALQVPLGALAGATVGVIIEPATVGSAAGLTSLGLAFGVGYSVDLFFSFLDELLGRLTGKSTSSAGPR